MGELAKQPSRAVAGRRRSEIFGFTLSLLIATVVRPAWAMPEALTPALEPVSSWNTGSSGLRETGMVAAPLSRNRLCRDLIVASGNDIFPQPLAVYRNQSNLNRGSFGQALPDWISNSTGFYGPITVGRIDDDKYPDVVISRYLAQPPLNQGACTLFRAGTVDVLWGDACRSGRDSTCGNAKSKEGLFGFEQTHRASPNPSQLVSDSLWPAAVALGDLDGDGDLDLAVAEPFRVAGDGLFRMAQLGSLASGARQRDDCGHAVNPIYPGQIRLYCNDRGHLSACPWWRPPEMFAASVMWFDLDLDGLLDLIVGSDRIYVHFGERSAAGAVTVQQEPQWMSRTTAAESPMDPLSAQYMGLAANWLDAKGCDGPPCIGLAIAATVGCPLLAEGGGPQSFWRRATCPGRVELFRAPRRAQPNHDEPIWTSTWRGSANQVALADLDGDDVAEIIFNGWWEDNPLDGAFADGVALHAAKIRPPSLRDQSNGSSLNLDENYFIATERAIGEAIVTADFSGYSWIKRQIDFQGVIDHPRWVLTLPAINVEAIAQLERGRAPNPWKVVTPEEYHVSTQGNTIQLRRPLTEGETVRVTFAESRATDVAVATWDPDKGILLYSNKLSRGPLYNNGDWDCFSPQTK